MLKTYYMEDKVMKTLICIISISFCVFLQLSVSGQDSPIDFIAESDTTQEDKLEYELIVTLPGYEAYLVTQLPMDFYSENYYKLWNQRYVTEWNIHYHSEPQEIIFENEIYYDPMTSYGIELEYRLYHFFRFFEKTYNISLIYRGK